MGGRWLAAVMGVALALTACGDDDEAEQLGDNETRRGGAVGAFIGKVDPICQEMQGAVGQLGDEAEKDRDAVQAGIGKIQALGEPPAEELERFQVFFARLQNVALALEDVNQARIQNDGPRAERALATAREQEDQVAQTARTYGMVECAQGVSASAS
jgi:hypothetical protein